MATKDGTNGGPTAPMAEGAADGPSDPASAKGASPGLIPTSPAGWAFFLDLDGTLIDLAASPDAVRAAPGLQAALVALEVAADGALAVVTGRSVAFVDGLLGHRFTVAGLHGAELRLSDGSGPDAPDLPPSFLQARSMAQEQAASLPGLLLEDKGRAFALHYRHAPDLRLQAEAIMAEAQAVAGSAFTLRDGKFVRELCPAGTDKGAIVRELMVRPPFRGRRPFAAGDDVTDEAMFRAVNALGGLSLRVCGLDENRPTAAQARLPSPAEFRLWMKGLIQ